MAGYEPLPKNALLRHRFKVKKQLSQGGMGAVYLAIDQEFEDRVAIKENFVQIGAGIDREASMAQFQEEAKVLRRLSNEHLPKVISQFPEGERQYLVMDFIAGKNLWETIKDQDAPLTEAGALNYIIQVCDAVNYLHRQDPPIIHRDIKPQNIIITPEDSVYLIDFGLAKIGGADTCTRLGARGGTLGYAPPEQFHSLARTTPASDIYALGATLYAILTATEPPESTGIMTGIAEFKPPEILNPKLSNRVSRAMAHAMEIKIIDRPASVAEWQRELKGLQQNLDTEVKQSLAEGEAASQAAEKADLYERMQAEMKGEKWAEALTLGSKLQQLDPNYEKLGQLMAESQQALDQIEVDRKAAEQAEAKRKAAEQAEAERQRRQAAAAQKQESETKAEIEAEALLFR